MGAVEAVDGIVEVAGLLKVFGTLNPRVVVLLVAFLLGVIG